MNPKIITTSPIMRIPKKNSGRLYHRLKQDIELKYSVKFNDTFEFNKWSVENVTEFWSEMWDFLGIVCSRKFYEVIDLKVPMSCSPKWFEGARLNYAENLMKFRDDGIALITLSEEAEPERITYEEMHKEVQLYAAAFRKFGLREGDVVACYLPNRKEALMAMLAAVSIGAIWTGAVPLLGSQAVLNRLRIVNPTILLTIDRFQQEKEEIEMLDKVKEISHGLESLKKVLVVSTQKIPSDISDIKNSCFLKEFLETGRRDDGSVPELTFKQVSFSHPVFINFTSGTTGKPKAIIHGCGALIPSVVEFGFQLDADRTSVWLSMSPVGWVSWNMVVGLLFTGCTLVLFEGEPYFLSPTYLWDMVESLRITRLFLPTNVAEKMHKQGYIPTQRHDISHLTTCLIGGSFVKPQLYDFVYHQIKEDILCSSCYGTTETIGMCLMPDPTVNIYRGELPMPCLGLDLQCVNEAGECVEGEMGELVIAKPYPALLLGLWNDADGSMFRKAYFRIEDGKFSLKDNAIVNPITKGFIVCGRSDDTLKQKGTRFGSSEIYSIVEQLPDVSDSLCVAQYSKDLEERAVLFLKVKEGHDFDHLLVDKIIQMIANHLTPSHVPEVILPARDIPYNTNRKKMEVLVKNVINKRPYNPESLVNPESLQYFENIPQLQDF